MTEIYEFFPENIKSQLPLLYSQEKSKDPIVHVKFFCPWNHWTWYATEGQIEGEDFLFFGYVVGHVREWGYFALSDLQSVTGPFGLKIERDMYFNAKQASEIEDIHTHYKPKNDGVQKQYCGSCDQDTPHEGKDCLVCGNCQPIIKEPVENLAYRTCRACGERYDTPHKSNCLQKRNPSTSSGEPRILVKMEDV
jgi:hypothetical protein